MYGLFDAFAPLIAAKPAPAAGGGDGMSQTILMLVPVVVLFYFMLLRPQQQQERKRREMLSALKKNDRVLTSSGIYGTVVSIDPEADRVVLRIDDDRGVKVAFSKASITRVLDVATEKPEKAETA
jgi:preprotein translocase subunit YajC